MKSGSRRRISVLHVLEDLRTGGSELQVANFVARSTSERFRHTVCTLKGAGPVAQELAKADVPVYSLGCGPDGIWLPVLRLAKLAGHLQADLIHASLFRPGIVSRIVGTLTRRPVVTTLVNTSYEPAWFEDNPRLNARKGRLAWTLDRLSSRWGTCFIAVNESVKASAMRQLAIPGDRITVIPRALPPSEFSNGNGSGGDVGAALGLIGAYPVILNVGRLVPQKGQRYAISAMPDVLERFPQAKLLIAGDGWLRPDLERLIESSGLSAHVQLLGERHDIPVLLGLADIFVFPSLFEGAANALLEAMAAGKPCVASRIPSHAEATRQGEVAVLVDSQSPKGIAEALLDLAERRDFSHALGQAAQSWVWARHGHAAVVELHEALYESLAARPDMHRAREVKELAELPFSRR